MDYFLSFLAFLLDFSIFIASIIAWSRGWKYKVLIVCGIGIYIQHITFIINMLLNGLETSRTVLFVNEIVWILILRLLIIMSSYEINSKDFGKYEILKIVKNLH